jgi:hypothetical protein
MTHESDDVERRGATNERSTTQDSTTPLLQQSSTPQKKGQNGWLWVPQLFGGGIYLPDPSTYDPIEILLNSADGRETDDLTTRWRDNKLSELNFVGIVVYIYILKLPRLNVN